MVAQLDSEFVRASPSRVVPRLISYALFEGRPLTTRGRWINPIVHANAELGARIGPRSRVERPIFLLGVGRSGTTLLGRLLGAHRQVGFLNEPKAMWHALVPDEDVIGSYANGDGRLELDEADATPAVIERAHRLFGWYLACTRSKRVVDKYPELVYRAPFVRALFPDAMFVAIIRSPGAVATSIATWSENHAPNGASWWGVEDRKWHALWEQLVRVDTPWATLADELDPHRASPLERGAVEWLLGTTRALSLCSAGEDGVHIVRYEDLVAQPERAVDELLARCGLPADERVSGLARTTVANGREPSLLPSGLHPGLVGAIKSVAAEAGYLP
jgi:hypothetical protein